MKNTLALSCASAHEADDVKFGMESVLESPAVERVAWTGSTRADCGGVAIIEWTRFVADKKPAFFTEFPT